MDDAFALEHAREMLADLDGDRADQDRPALVVDIFDFVEDGGVFLALGLVNGVVRVLAGYGPIGRNHQDAQFVNVEKFASFGFGSAGHTGELVVQAKIILDGNSRQRLGFAFDGNPFLGFDGLVQPIAPAAAGHQTAGVFIDDDDLVVLDDVLNLFEVKGVGLKQLRDSMNLLSFGLVFLLKFCFGLGTFAR